MKTQPKSPESTFLENGPAPSEMISGQDAQVEKEAPQEPEWAFDDDIFEGEEKERSLQKGRREEIRHSGQLDQLK